MIWPFGKKQAEPPPEPKPKGTIRQRSVDKAAQQETRLIKPYEPPPGVIPDDDKDWAMAQDSTPYQYANQQLTGSFVGYFFPGYQELAQLAQLPEYRKMAEAPARAMVREWIDLHGTGDEDKTDKIAIIETELKRHRVRDLFRRAAELDDFFGRAQLYVDVKMPGGGDASENEAELKTPLSLTPQKVKKGSLKGFELIEPIWTYPSGYEADNPLSGRFYKPERWFVMGKTIHDSRLLKFVSREVPDLLKPAYNFGGLSMSQMARPYVEHWIRTRDAVSNLVHSYSTSGIKTNMSSTLDGSDDASFFNRAQLFSNMRDNKGLMLLDNETEDFFQFNTPLAGLSELQAQSQEHMAAVSNIPLVELLGVTPTGLNASSEGEIRVWYDYVGSRQENIFRKPLETIIHLIMLDQFGEIDDEIDFDFQPLYGMDELQESQIRASDAQADVAWVSVGALDPNDVRRRLANEPDSGYEGMEFDDDSDLDERDNMLDNPDDQAGSQSEGKEDDGHNLNGRANVLKTRARVNDDAAMDADWEESKHPRQDDGKFGSGGGSKSSAKGKSDHMDLYSGSANKIDKIHGEGHFGGIFASPSENDASSHGDNIHKVSVPNGSIASTSDLSSHKGASKAISAAIPDGTPKEKEMVERYAVDDHDVFKDVQNGDVSESAVIAAANKIEGAEPAENLGEASWAFQRARGLIAGNLGYKAVEMRDEHGLSYLVLPGSEVKAHSSGKQESAESRAARAQEEIAAKKDTKVEEAKNDPSRPNRIAPEEWAQMGRRARSKAKSQ